MLHKLYLPCGKKGKENKVFAVPAMKQDMMLIA